MGDLCVRREYWDGKHLSVIFAFWKEGREKKFQAWVKATKEIVQSHQEGRYSLDLTKNVGRESHDALRYDVPVLLYEMKDGERKPRDRVPGSHLTSKVS